MNRFLKDEKDNWRRLEDLLDMMRGSGLRGLSRMEVREFGELYRRAASDLAIARSETRDPKLINYLNSLVIRAHGKIYRADTNGAAVMWRFFTKDFPQTFRKNGSYILLAFGVFMFFSVASFFLCYYSASFVDHLGLDSVRFAAQNNMRWWESLNAANQIGSSQIL